MKSATASIIVIIAFALCGCAATLPMASADRDATAKTFATTVDKANIYIYRNEVIPFGIALPIILNGRTSGALAIKTYLLLVVPPGEQKLFCDYGSGTDLRLTTESGRNYFISVQANTGFLEVRPSVQLVGEAAGREAVEKCSMVEARR